MKNWLRKLLGPTADQYDLLAAYRSLYRVAEVYLREKQNPVPDYMLMESDRNLMKRLLKDIEVIERRIGHEPIKFTTHKRLS